MFQETRGEEKIRKAAVNGVGVEHVSRHHVWPKSAKSKIFCISGEYVQVGKEDIDAGQNKRLLTDGEHGAAHYVFAVICRRTGLNDLAIDHLKTAKGFLGRIDSQSDLLNFAVWGIIGGILAQRLFEMPTRRLPK